MSYDTSIMKIGTYLVHKGVIKLEQAKAVLNAQQQMRGTKARFGRIAVQKGYLSEARLNEVMMAKYQAETPTEEE